MSANDSSLAAQKISVGLIRGVVRVLLCPASGGVQGGDQFVIHSGRSFVFRIAGVAGKPAAD